MLMEQISAVQGVQGLQGLQPLNEPQPRVLETAPLSGTAPTGKPGAGFADFMVQQAGAVNDKLITAEHAVQSLAGGEAPNLHEVMIQLEEARLPFQLLVQVRNKMLEAYQEVMRMQV